MTFLAITIGMPGCGKSTFAQTAASYGWIDEIVHPDSIREELTGDMTNQSRNKDVWRLCYKRAEEHLRNRSSVLIDATFLTPKTRKDPLDLVDRLGVGPCMAIRFQTTPEECFRRNLARDRNVPEDVMRRFALNLLNDCVPEQITAEGFALLDPVGLIARLMRNMDEAGKTR